MRAVVELALHQPQGVLDLVEDVLDAVVVVDQGQEREQLLDGVVRAVDLVGDERARGGAGWVELEEAAHVLRDRGCEAVEAGAVDVVREVRADGRSPRLEDRESSAEVREGLRMIRTRTCRP